MEMYQPYLPHERFTMKRRTLDVVFSIVGLAVAALLLVLFGVLRNNADFAKSYVSDQLTQQKITFTPADKLSAEEKASPCLVTYAGQALASGKQAECYANKYIGLHVKAVNSGKTYSETSAQSRAARTAADTALKANANDPAALDLDKTAKTLALATDTLFKGETLRGLLLTSYGFSIFGQRASQAAYVCLAAALLLMLATAAGFVHALRTRRDEPVFRSTTAIAA